MTRKSKIYLALGDSMSIDRYTGVPGGGAVSQFHSFLGDAWTLDDRACDMCRMRYVPTNGRGDLITLTIGGNDLLADMDEYLRGGLAGFQREHLELLSAIRERNLNACFIVGNVYAPQTELTEPLRSVLDEANAMIQANVKNVDARLADIHQAFHGNEAEYLCHDIEPSFKGATMISRLFREAAGMAAIYST